MVRKAAYANLGVSRIPPDFLVLLPLSLLPLRVRFSCRLVLIGRIIARVVTVCLFVLPQRYAVTAQRQFLKNRHPSHCENVGSGSLLPRSFILILTRDRFCLLAFDCSLSHPD